MVGSDNQKQVCSTRKQVEELTNFSSLLESMDENEIYNLTGCMAPCDKSEFEVASQKGPWTEEATDSESDTTTLAFVFKYVRLNDDWSLNLASECN